MPFIQPEDYTKQIQDHILSQVIGGDTSLLADAELAAISEMESYLSGRFNTTAIFTAQNDERHPLVLMYCIDITLYHLHSRVSPRNVSQLRTDRYNRAIEWMQQVVTGELSPGLPPKTAPDGAAENRLRWGSNPKPNLHF